MVHGGKCMARMGYFGGIRESRGQGVLQGSTCLHPRKAPPSCSAGRDGGETNLQPSDLPLGYLAPTMQEIDLGQSHEGRRAE